MIRQLIVETTLPKGQRVTGVCTLFIGTTFHGFPDRREAQGRMLPLAGGALGHGSTRPGDAERSRRRGSGDGARIVLHGYVNLCTHYRCILAPPLPTPHCTHCTHCCAAMQRRNEGHSRAPDAPAPPTDCAKAAPAAASCQQGATTLRAAASRRRERPVAPITHSHTSSPRVRRCLLTSRNDSDCLHHAGEKRPVESLVPESARGGRRRL